MCDITGLQLWEGLEKGTFANSTPQLMFYCHRSAGAVGGTEEHNKEEKLDIFLFFFFFPQTAQVQRASEEFKLRTDFVNYSQVCPESC